MLLDLILSLGVRRRHTPVFLNTPPCYSYGIGVVFTTFLILLGILVKEVVLVWYWFLIVLIVSEEAAGSRSHRKSMKMASTSSKNEQILRKTALKSVKNSRQT